MYSAFSFLGFGLIFLVLIVRSKKTALFLAFWLSGSSKKCTLHDYLIIRHRDSVRFMEFHAKIPHMITSVINVNKMGAFKQAYNIEST